MHASECRRCQPTDEGERRGTGVAARSLVGGFSEGRTDGDGGGGAATDHTFLSLHILVSLSLPPSLSLFPSRSARSLILRGSRPASPVFLVFVEGEPLPRRCHSHGPLSHTHNTQQQRAGLLKHTTRAAIRPDTSPLPRPTDRSSSSSSAVAVAQRAKPPVSQPASHRRRPDVAPSCSCVAASLQCSHTEMDESAE